MSSTDPVPPPYSAAASAPSVPPPTFSSGYPPQPDSGAYPPPTAGYAPTTYGTAYPPTNTEGYPQPPAYGNTNASYNTGSINYASDPEAGYIAKDVSPILSFDDKSIRLAYVRKVFAILGLQMLVTTGIICLFVFHEPTKEFVQKSTATYISAYVLFLVLYFVLVCCNNLARSHPTNIILLAIFTLSLSYLVGAISSFHDTKIVLLLFGMTCLVSLAIMIFACQTKYDFTSCSGVLFVCALCLLLFGLFGAVLVPTGAVRFVNIVYASLGALLFMAFLAFDTQLVMGGGRKYQLSPEDYVFGALMLYVDIIYIFIFLLAIFGGGSK